MAQPPFQPNRRKVLQSAVGLTLAHLAAQATGAAAAVTGAAASASLPGAPGDFAFLAGEWTISHRRLSADGTWDEFEGEATCWTILDGVGSVEELRIPARGFSGMGLRLLDVGNAVWSDFWVNGRSGVLTTPGATGRFIDGVGTFLADDVDGDRPIQVRGVWDRITPDSCRWHQALSYDAGQTWKQNWFMDWRRT